MHVFVVGSFLRAAFFPLIIAAIVLIKEFHVFFMCSHRGTTAEARRERRKD